MIHVIFSFIYYTFPWFTNINNVFIIDSSLTVMGITVGSCFILLTIAILALIISKNKTSEISTTERNLHQGCNIFISHFLEINIIFCISISVCSISSLLIILPFSGDVNGYGIRIDPIEPITQDFPIEPTVITAIPTPSPRRSILREPRRRSVHFEDGNIS